MNAPANTMTMRQQHQAYCDRLLAGDRPINLKC